MWSRWGASTVGLLAGGAVLTAVLCFFLSHEEQRAGADEDHIEERLQDNSRAAPVKPKQPEEEEERSREAEKSRAITPAEAYQPPRVNSQAQQMPLSTLSSTAKSSWPFFAHGGTPWTTGPRRCEAQMSAAEKRDLDMMFRHQGRCEGRAPCTVDLEKAKARQRKRRGGQVPDQASNTEIMQDEVLPDLIAKTLIEEEAARTSRKAREARRRKARKKGSGKARAEAAPVEDAGAEEGDEEGHSAQGADDPETPTGTPEAAVKGAWAPEPAEEGSAPLQSTEATADEAGESEETANGEYGNPEEEEEFSREAPGAPQRVDAAEEHQEAPSAPEAEQPPTAQPSRQETEAEQDSEIADEAQPDNEVQAHGHEAAASQGHTAKLPAAVEGPEGSTPGPRASLAEQEAQLPALNNSARDCKSSSDQEPEVVGMGKPPKAGPNCAKSPGLPDQSSSTSTAASGRPRKAWADFTDTSEDELDFPSSGQTPSTGDGVGPHSHKLGD